MLGQYNSEERDADSETRDPELHSRSLGPCHLNARTSLTRTKQNEDQKTPLALTLRLLIYLNFTQNEVCCAMAGSLAVGLARRGNGDSGTGVPVPPRLELVWAWYLCG